MQVRHAQLQNVYGRSAKHGGFAIVPADVQLAGSMFRPGFHLHELPADRIPPALRGPLANGYYVAWVRARLPIAFGCAPETSEQEKTFLIQGFVAVQDGSALGTAFECSDYYGQTSLLFSPEENDEQLKAQIADAFWSVLLADPDQLADFSGRFEHDGGTLEYGCSKGGLYAVEVDEEEE